MLQVTRKNNVIVGAVCVLLVCCCAFSAEAADRVRGIQPIHLQILLNAAGFQAETIRLDDGTGFKNGLFIQDVHNSNLLIKFPRRGIKQGVPFVIAVDGVEEQVERSGDGRITGLDGNGYLFASGIADMVDCILEAADTMIDGIDSCSVLDIGCILNAVFDGVRAIIDCI